MYIFSKTEEGKFKSRQRVKILTEAYRQFVEKGIEAVNMQDIAAACEMERRTLYNYYNNKEQIALQLMECWYQELVKISDIEDVTFPNAYEKLKALVYSFYDFVVADPDAIRYSVHFDHFFRSKYSDLNFDVFVHEETKKILHDDLILQGIEDGSIKPKLKDNATEVSLAIQGAMLSYAQRIVFRENHRDLSLIKILLDSLLDSVHNTIQ